MIIILLLALYTIGIYKFGYLNGKIKGAEFVRDAYNGKYDDEIFKQ